jgi:hypothetical protein
MTTVSTPAVRSRSSRVGADEAAVHHLLDHRLFREWHGFGLELERLRSPAEEFEVLLHALVTDVHDRRVRVTPGSEQVRDPGLRVRVVSLRPVRIVERALDVDHQ